MLEGRGNHLLEQVSSQEQSRALIESAWSAGEVSRTTPIDIGSISDGAPVWSFPVLLTAEFGSQWTPLVVDGAPKIQVSTLSRHPLECFEKTDDARSDKRLKGARATLEVSTPNLGCRLRCSRDAKAGKSPRFDFVQQ